MAKTPKPEEGVMRGAVLQPPNQVINSRIQLNPVQQARVKVLNHFHGHGALRSTHELVIEAGLRVMEIEMDQHIETIKAANKLPDSPRGRRSGKARPE